MVVQSRPVGRREKESCKNMKPKMPKWLNVPLKSKEHKFAEASVLIDLVIKKSAPGLLICGTPGIGKSRLVKERLNAAMQLDRFHYRVVKGHGSALGLYSLLYECRKMLLVLDDADSLFQDPRSVNILKAALDSYDDARVISWQSQSARNLDVPMSFEFSGSVIFVSNIDEKEMDPAVLSRSFHYNLFVTPEEIIATMYNLIGKMEPDVDIDHKAEVLEYIKDNKHLFIESGKLNLRTLVNGIRIRASGTPMWKELLKKSA